jgi:hypothetical protein
MKGTNNVASLTVLSYPFLWCFLSRMPKCEGVSKSFRTQTITKYTVYAYIWYYSLRNNTEVMAAKLTRLTHKIAIQLHVVAESCIICSSRSRRPVRKLLDTSSYSEIYITGRNLIITNVRYSSIDWLIVWIIYLLFIYLMFSLMSVCCMMYSPIVPAT